MAGSGGGAVLMAVVGNAVITIAKFVAFLVSGSGAMLSESIHSFADTGNQGLLYAGIRRSERRPDEDYHYGYGGQRFLFALFSAMGIFVLGCGVTIYHGVSNLLHPHEIEVGWLVWAVLGLSFAVDAYVFSAAIREMNLRRDKQGILQFIRTSTDPTLLAVLFEDFVATSGVIVAAVGIWMSKVTGNAAYDAVSSIIIGIMLGAVAVWLGVRNSQLILGPAIPAHVAVGAIALLREQPSVQHVREFKTRIVGSERYKIAAEIDYDGRYLARTLLPAAAERARAIDSDTAAEEFVVDFGEQLIDALGQEVDRIEAALKARYPELHHMELESDWRPDD